jgi:hypothetical protein
MTTTDTRDRADELADILALALDTTREYLDRIAAIIGGEVQADDLAYLGERREIIARALTDATVTLSELNT